MSERYQVKEGAEDRTRFNWSVFDTQQKDEVWDRPALVAETFRKEVAERIAQALNAQEDARERLEVGPAVVYRDANQNTPSAKGVASALGLDWGL